MYTISSFHSNLASPGPPQDSHLLSAPHVFSVHNPDKLIFYNGHAHHIFRFSESQKRQQNGDIIHFFAPPVFTPPPLDLAPPAGLAVLLPLLEPGAPVLALRAPADCARAAKLREEVSRPALALKIEDGK